MSQTWNPVLGSQPPEAKEADTRGAGAGVVHKPCGFIPSFSAEPRFAQPARVPETQVYASFLVRSREWLTKFRRVGV